MQFETEYVEGYAVRPRYMSAYFITDHGTYGIGIFRTLHPHLRQEDFRRPGHCPLAGKTRQDRQARLVIIAEDY